MVSRRSGFIPRLFFGNNLVGAALRRDFLWMRSLSKGHAALRKGRISATGLSYFVTICLLKDQKGLDSTDFFEGSLATLLTIEADGKLELIALVHMPDHLHLLFCLESDHSLSDSIRLYKGKMAPLLRKNGLKWQRGYFDRWLRETDSIGVVLQYMLMNPYRKTLIPKEQRWPYWFCTKEAKKWMSLDEDVPYPEWLNC